MKVKEYLVSPTYSSVVILMIPTYTGSPNSRGTFSTFGHLSLATSL